MNSKTNLRTGYKFLYQVSPKSRVRDLLGKGGTPVTKLAILGGMYTSYYLGAALGSLAVATGRYHACGATIADALWEIRQNGITPPSWLQQHFANHPEILSVKNPKNSASGRIYYQKALN